MDGLTFTKTNFRIGGKDVYFNSGEFHYFRVPKHEWRRRMDLLKAAGGNAVATYIPWLIHEPEEGKFVFDQGDGVTDLSDFLQCAKDAGLFVIARPGPYAYSELIDHGLPRWLLEKYPQILSQKRDGSHHGSANVSYLHPVFLEKARILYSHICPILARFSQTDGGPVALVQIDNELTGIHVWFGDRDFNRETMGFGRGDGRYARFLAEKYGTVDAVNAVYGTAKASFGEFGPEDEPASGAAKYRWNEDYIHFYNAGIAEYIGKLIGYAEENGIAGPFCHNAANPWMDSVFRESKKRLGGKLLIGSDHYYMLCQNWGQNNPTPQFLIYCFFSAEILRLMGNPPCVFESQYGSISEWPPTRAEDLETMLLCQLASGVRGHNGYVFTGGPNPPGLGSTCRVYDYDAPVGADGSVRPTYDAIRRFGAFVENHPELAGDRADADVRLAMPWRCFLGVGGEFHPRAAETGMLANTFQTGLLTSFFAMDLQPELADLEADGWDDDRSTPLFITCDGVMPEAIQRRLAAFVRSGGSIVLTPVIPFLDENYRPCTVLSDAFGGASTGEKRHTEWKLYDFGGPEIFNINAGAVFAPGTIPAGAEILGRETADGTPCAWKLDVPGGGALLWFGLTSVLQRLAFADALRRTFEAAHGTARWRSGNTWVLTFRRRTEKGTLVFLANPGTSVQTVNAEIRTGGGEWRPIPKITLGAMTVKTIEI